MTMSPEQDLLQGFGQGRAAAGPSVIPAPGGTKGDIIRRRRRDEWSIEKHLGEFSSPTPELSVCWQGCSQALVSRSWEERTEV